MPKVVSISGIRVGLLHYLREQKRQGRAYNTAYWSDGEQALPALPTAIIGSIEPCGDPLRPALARGIPVFGEGEFPQLAHIHGVPKMLLGEGFRFSHARVEPHFACPHVVDDFRHEGAFPQRAGGNVDKVINDVASIRFRQGHGRSLGTRCISFNCLAKDLCRVLEQALKADEITGDPKSGKSSGPVCLPLPEELLEVRRAESGR